MNQVCCVKSSQSELEQNDNRIKILNNNSTTGEITNADEARSQGLKYLPHWPPVSIDFEDVVYTVDSGTESK